MRPILSANQVHPAAASFIQNYHSTAVAEAAKAINQHEWVIVGMAQNIFVKKARRLLESKQASFHYIEHGSYFSEWKTRLAIKLWSGWPTFPQVFHKGILIGGFKDLEKYLNT